ncbi:MAG: internal scaffolding protein [Microvirus sp.]|nr:MAG: internal scaffolding protein [Microvirus sp.]
MTPKANGEVELSLREKEFMLTNALIKETIRPDGSRRIQQDFSHCPSMTEQHTAHLTDINYLIQKYKPDELAAYIAARNQHRREILGWDFSQELNLQEAQNVVYRSRQAFEELPEEIKKNFKNHVEFIKFIDNEANVEKMIEFGILSRKEIDAVKIEKPEPVPEPLAKKASKKETAES